MEQIGEGTDAESLEKGRMARTHPGDHRNRPVVCHGRIISAARSRFLIKMHDETRCRRGVCGLRPDSGMAVCGTPLW